MNSAGTIVHCDDVLAASQEQAVQHLGGKAVSLRRLAQLGLRVPPSMTVTTEAYRDYVHSPDAWRRSMLPAIDVALQRLQHLSDSPDIIQGCFAVRSGAPISMPGQLTTILYAGRSRQQVTEIDTPTAWAQFEQFLDGMLSTVAATEQGKLSGDVRDRCRQKVAIWEQSRRTMFPSTLVEIILESIATVFDSWNTASARAFRARLQIRDDLGTAVTIQQMLQADISGVAFSCDPHNPQRQQGLVELVVGQGEQLVSGRKTPISWTFDTTADNSKPESEESLDDWTATTVVPQSVQRFTQEHRHELYRAISAIRAEWQCDVDVEWAWSNGTLYFLQARPITGVVNSAVAALQSRVVAQIRSAARTTRSCWVRHPLSESLPHPTPLTWSLIRRWMRGDGSYGTLFRLLGFRPSPRVCREGFLELFGGRIYADFDRVREYYHRSYPLSFDIEQLRNDPQCFEHGPEQYDPDRLPADLLLRLPSLVMTMWCVRRRFRRHQSTAVNEFQSAVQQLREATNQPQDLFQLRTEQLQEHFRFLVELTNRCWPRLLLPGTLGVVAVRRLEAQLRRLLGETDGACRLQQLVENIPDPLLRRKQTLLQRSRDDQAAERALIEEFGHRAAGEMELATPRDIEAASDTVDISFDSISTVAVDPPLDAHEESSCKTNSFIADTLQQSLREAGVESLAPPLQLLLDQAVQWIPYRERGRHELMRLFLRLRQVNLELASRFDFGESIFFLTAEELQNLNTDTREMLLQQATSRQAEWVAEQSLKLPDVIEAQDLSKLFDTHELTPTAVQTEATQAELTGTGLAQGVAEGTVVVRDAQAMVANRSGGLLVCESLDAGEMSQLVDSRGVIVEHGGRLSHGAILARQLGLPVVRLSEARSRLQPGQRVRIDGTSGQVLILEARE